MGAPILGPLRRPETEAKKLLRARRRSFNDCCRATFDTSARKDRSGVRFASVVTLEATSLNAGAGESDFKASRNIRKASFQTTRQDPKVFAIMIRCGSVG